MFSNLEKEQKRKITAQLKSPNVDSPRMNQSLATKLVAWNKDTYFAQLVAALSLFMSVLTHRHSMLGKKIEENFQKQDFLVRRFKKQSKIIIYHFYSG